MSGLRYSDRPLTINQGQGRLIMSWSNKFEDQDLYISYLKWFHICVLKLLSQFVCNPLLYWFYNLVELVHSCIPQRLVEWIIINCLHAGKRLEGSLGINKMALTSRQEFSKLFMNSSHTRNLWIKVKEFIWIVIYRIKSSISTE